MKPQIKNQIESFTRSEIIAVHSLGGGCIGSASRIDCAGGKPYFLKSYSSVGSAMLACEANGLRELHKAGAVKVPQVLLQNSEFLLLEYVAPGHKDAGFFETFGRQFARMHRCSSQSFGFYEDNFIGATPQYNIAEGSEKTDWSEFYWIKRLLPQYKLAEQNGLIGPDLKSRFSKIEHKLTSILSGSEEPPALLHGDLWSGNYLADTKGDAWIIDPAVYYGHREADLAMTKLFGGFSPEFYAAYNDEFPLPIGYEYRENIYLLYHVMNHLNLFGHSYYAHAVELCSGW